MKRESGTYFKMRPYSYKKWGTAYVAFQDPGCRAETYTRYETEELLESYARYTKEMSEPFRQLYLPAVPEDLSAFFKKHWDGELPNLEPRVNLQELTETTEGLMYRIDEAYRYILARYCGPYLETWFRPEEMTAQWYYWLSQHCAQSRSVWEPYYTVFALTCPNAGDLNRTYPLPVPEKLYRMTDVEMVFSFK